MRRRSFPAACLVAPCLSCLLACGETVAPAAAGDAAASQDTGVEAGADASAPTDVAAGPDASDAAADGVAPDVAPDDVAAAHDVLAAADVPAAVDAEDTAPQADAPVPADVPAPLDTAAPEDVPAPAEVAEPVDAGPADTGPADTGPADTGVADAAPADTGPATCPSKAFKPATCAQTPMTVAFDKTTGTANFCRRKTSPFDCKLQVAACPADYAHMYTLGFSGTGVGQLSSGDIITCSQPTAFGTGGKVLSGLKPSIEHTAQAGQYVLTWQWIKGSKLELTMTKLLQTF